MYPRGTIYHIYDPDKSGPRAEIYLRAPVKTRAFYTLIRGIGAGLIGFAIIAFLFTYGPVIKEEINYSLGRNTLKTLETETLFNQAEAQRVKAVQAEAASYGVGAYYSIVIPKIGAKAEVIANVDAADEAEYKEALKKGVAHAAGTYFPGQDRNIFLFAHSTNGDWNVSRYNAIFYLLRKLEGGDKIIVFFADKKYEYTVEQKLTTKADDVSWLSDDNTGEKLILQTCDPPGTTINRMLVIARPS